MNPQNRLYTFRCPECKNEFVYDQPAEPLCDGPGVFKAHEPKVMHRIRVKSRDKTKEVGPEEGVARAKGAVLTPETITGMRLRVGGKLWTPKDGINPWTGLEMDDPANDEILPDQVEIHNQGE